MNPLAKRIEELQKLIKTSVTGIFDLDTTNAFLGILEIPINGTLDFQERKKAIQKFLGFRGNAVDGIMGINTMSRLEMLFSHHLPPIPVGASLIVSRKSLGMIVEFEVSSKAVYERNFKNPVLPGEYSGITIGIGYDLGYVTIATFTNDWKDSLSEADFKTLSKVVGKTQNQARESLSPEVKKVTIEWNIALEVFYTKSMPIWAKSSKKFYPGLEKLPPDAQGAIVSLVYNRGPILSGDDRRREMRNLVPLIANQNLFAMANEIRSMKRLWPDSRGLQRRRDKEADLVENSSFIIQPENLVFI